MTDSSMAPDAELGKRLVCPYCGNDFEAELSYTGGGYSEHRDLTGFECENYLCDARWTKRGDVERISKMVAE